MRTTLGGREGSATRRAHHPRARAPAHVGPPGHHPRIDLRLRKVARLEADHARGGDPADGRRLRPVKVLSQLLRRADVHERMPHGENFNYTLLHAVVDPVIVMAAENLADFGAI